MSSDTSDSAFDPAQVSTRADLAAALTALRLRAGLTVREVVARSGGLHGTIAGWFGGQHLPTKASLPMFDAMLRSCGVPDGELAAWAEAVQRARRANAPKRSQAPSPYRGLEAFDRADAEWFFGRSALIDELVDRVERAGRGELPRMQMVIGPSGSGKSSLLRAGLSARIDDAVLITPGSDPLGALEEAGVAPDRVLIIDQLEELWTQSSDEGRRAQFLDRLADPASGRVVVLGLRADFYGQASAEAALVPALDAGPLVVGPMTREQYQDVIVAPAEKAGLTVAEDLVQLLIDEVAPRNSPAGSLPLLSHALLGTWSRASRKTLTTADYFATGAIAGAVQQTAEEAYGELTPAQQLTARRVFLRLVNVDEDSVTRHRARRMELFLDDESAAETADVNTVIDLFAARRLLTLGDETVEVSHEALLSAWDRLRGWVDEDRAGLILRRQVTQSARLWLDGDLDEGMLLRGHRLSVIEDWAEDPRVRQDYLSDDELSFLDASTAQRENQERAERRRIQVLRRFVTALALTSVLALVLAGLAIVSGVSANKQKAIAEDARTAAMSRQIATNSVGQRDKDPALAAQLALAAYRVSPTLEARSALFDATALHASTRLVGPPGGVKARVGAGGAVIASAASDGTVRLWEADRVGIDDTPASTTLITDETTPLYALAISPDGNLLAAGGPGDTSLWDISSIASPRRVANLIEGSSQETTTENAPIVVQDLAFSPDGSQLAAGDSAGGTLRWDLADPGSPVALPPLPTQGASRIVVAYSPDGQALATGGESQSLRIWDARSRSPEAPIFEAPSDGGTAAVLSVAFSPDGSLLAAGTSGREIRRWSMADPARPDELPALAGFEGYVNEITFSPDSQIVAGGSSDNTVRMWRLADDQLLETLPGPGVVTTAHFSPDGSTLVSGGVDGAVRVWPLPGPVLTGTADTIFSTSVDVDRDLLLVGAGRTETVMHLWDIADPATPVRLGGVTHLDGDVFTGAATLSPAAKLAAGGTTTGLVYLWDVSDPARPEMVGLPFESVGDIVNSLGFSPDGSLLAVSPQSGHEVQLFDVTTPARPAKVATIEVSNYPQIVKFSPSGDQLAIGNANNRMELFDITDPAAPRMTSSLDGFETYAQAAGYSPDGTVFAAGSADQSVQLFDMADPLNPVRITHLKELSGSVYSLDFDASGTRLAASLASGQVIVWDTTNPANPEVIGMLSANGHKMFDAQFGGGGTVVAGGGERVARLWSTDAESAAAEICATAGTPVTEAEWNRHLPGVPYQELC